MEIPIFFLGTGQAIPTAKRNHTAVLLKYKDENILIDCGEGTQRQFRKAKLNFCKLTRILITHWHGDHVLGLPGLLQSLALNNYKKTLYIYGPKGTKKFLDLITNIFIREEEIKIIIREISEGKVFETSDFFVFALPMKHKTRCLAYSFVEKDKVKINKEKLKKTGLPSSPLIAKLKEGKNIVWQGKEIKVNQLTYKVKGKKITFIFDTALNKNTFKIAKDSNLLVCEAPYTSEEEELAKEHKHLIARQTGEIARKARVKKLLLTHISQRHENDENKILSEAKKIFKNTKIAHDLEKVLV